MRNVSGNLHCRALAHTQFRHTDAFHATPELLHPFAHRWEQGPYNTSRQDLPHAGCESLKFPNRRLLYVFVYKNYTNIPILYTNILPIVYLDATEMLQTSSHVEGCDLAAGRG